MKNRFIRLFTFYFLLLPGMVAAQSTPLKLPAATAPIKMPATPSGLKIGGGGAAPTDTTPPVIGQAVASNIGSTSMTVTASCIDPETGCVSAFIDHDVDPGDPYAVSTVASLNAGQISATITGLPVNQTRFFRARAINGAGLAGVGAENNAQTLGTQNYFFSVNATGSRAATKCIDTNDSTRCPLSELSTLVAGDTAILKNGQYNTAVNLDCSFGAPQSGTSSLPITIKAENERQAQIVRTSGSSFMLQHCSWFVIQGIRFSSAQGSGGYAADFWLDTDVVVKRNILDTCDSALNYHLLAIRASERFTIEENELWNCQRHYIYLSNRTLEGGGTGNHIVRRNYCNTFPAASGPGSCVVVYPSSGNIIENNIAEGMGSGFEIEPEFGANTPQATNNQFLGNINVNTGFFAQCRQSNTSFWPTNTTVKDMVISGGDLFFKAGVGIQIQNVTMISPPAGLFYTTDSLNCPSVAGGSFTITNSIVMSGAGRGFIATIGASGSLNSTNGFNNAGGNYDIDGYTNTNALTSDPSLGGCFLFVRAASPRKGAGVGGADIGANILFATENGSLTSKKLLNSATNQWLSTYIGATVTGVNDGAATLSNVIGRLQPGCSSWPVGY